MQCIVQLLLLDCCNNTLLLLNVMFSPELDVPGNPGTKLFSDSCESQTALTRASNCCSYAAPLFVPLYDSCSALANSFAVSLPARHTPTSTRVLPAT